MTTALQTRQNNAALRSGMNNLLHTSWRYVPVVILAIAWELVSRMGLISETTLPPLTSVLQRFIQLMADDMWYHTVRSITRGAAALGGAILIGTAVGVLMAWFQPIRMFVNPFIRMFYPMPKSALIPLAIMWFGLGDSSKIILIFIGCLLPIVVSSFNAARGVDDVLIWSARGMGATESEVLREVVIPGAMPEILNGIRVALALCFILLVSGEMIIANDGIGFLIGFLGEGGDYSGMFAGVVTISAIGFFADRGYVMLMKRLLIWRE